MPESELPRSGAFGREEHNASSEGEKEAPPAKMHCSESDQKVSSSGDGSEHEKVCFTAAFIHVVRYFVNTS